MPGKRVRSHHEKQFTEEQDEFHFRQRLSTGFPGGSVLKNLPAVQDRRVQSLGWNDPLEEEMEIHSSILAWTEEPGKATVHGVRVGHNLETKEQIYTSSKLPF